MGEGGCQNIYKITNSMYFMSLFSFSSNLDVTGRGLAAVSILLDEIAHSIFPFELICR
jgi:hypothetical protein